MSCKKEANAETPVTGTPLKQPDVVLYMKSDKSGSNQASEIWICKIVDSNTSGAY
jgi:hypothetical protein